MKCISKRCPFPDENKDGCRFLDCCDFVVMQKTNADRIRAMSDEELAAYLVYHNPYSTEEFCLKWLRQPVKDGEGDGNL